jgi:hypothetical protein
LTTTRGKKKKEGAKPLLEILRKSGAELYFYYVRGEVSIGEYLQ